MPSKPLSKRQKPNGPSFPLEPRREAFASAIVNGMKLQEAHKLAGFTGATHAAAFNMRHRPEIDARIRWLLSERVKVDSHRYARRQNRKGDLLQRALAKLDDIMSTDVRELVDWRKEAVLNAAGEVVEVVERMSVKDASAISAKAASAIKGLITKGGRLQVELHDQRAAATDIVRLLTGSDAQPAGNVTVNQVNVGAVSAADAAQRVMFLLASVANRIPPPKTIDAVAVHNSQDTDGQGDH